MEKLVYALELKEQLAPAAVANLAREAGGVRVMPPKHSAKQATLLGETESRA